MDSYTAKTKEWLNQRFRQTKDGIFFAHQNIYGFKSPYVEEGVVLRYVIFYNVLKALSLLRFESLLDVGGAEGYMAAAIRKFFQVRVRSCDLSEEACKRAEELFQIEADPVDGVSLPYEDDSFDVVLSSESLEHIPRYELVLEELLRVARKAVLITVPHDGPKAIAENIRNQVPHGHLHDFTLNSFKALIPTRFILKRWGLYSSFLRLPFRCVEGRDINPGTGLRRWVIEALNVFVRAAGKTMNERAFKTLLRLDGILAQWFGSYRQLVFVIVKDPTSLTGNKTPLVEADAMLGFRVPFLRLAMNPTVELQRVRNKPAVNPSGKAGAEDRADPVNPVVFPESCG